MSAVIVGSPSAVITAANAKVLRRQQYQKESNGLETLVETYIVQSQNLISIIPAKNTTHSAFSTATTKFPRMAVESISTSEQDGNLSELNVTYVGLASSSGLPAAIVRIIPVTGAGKFGLNINIEAEFLSDSSEPQLLAGTLSSISPTIIAGRYNQRRMPRAINGTSLPPNPIEPYFRSNTAGFGVGSSVFKTTSVTDAYEGYCINDTQLTRRGQFLVVTMTFQEFRFFSVSQ